MGVAGIFLSGALGMANAVDPLSATLGDYARNLQRGETAWADLDAATFGALMSAGGADYIYTMGVVNILMAIGDIAVTQGGGP